MEPGKGVGKKGCCVKAVTPFCAPSTEAVRQVGLPPRYGLREDRVGIFAYIYFDTRQARYTHAAASAARSTSRTTGTTKPSPTAAATWFELSARPRAATVAAL